MTAIQLDQTIADDMVKKAVASCANLRFAGDTSQTMNALSMGRCDICGCLSDCLVQEVGQYLGRMDRTVKAVYKVEPEYSSLRPAPLARRAAARKAGINLVTWVERKSAALTALGATLEKLLSESRRKIKCRNATTACYILDIEMVDDRDVEEWRSYGMVVNSPFVHSIQVWKRPDAGKASEVKAVQETGTEHPVVISFNPELTPEQVLFEQAQAIENMSAADRVYYDYRLRELKVALIRRLISDQLAYIRIAQEWFTIEDLMEIHKRKIGNGKIGGKAAGMLLASRILSSVADESLKQSVRVPESYFLGSDLIYLFMAMNGLMHWNNQKYKTEERIRSEYPQLRAEFEAGEFPPEVVQELGCLLAKIGNKPLVVRSSSLLEDNFGTTFAGKYETHFLPNQGRPDQNLNELTRAIARIYASTLRPDALLYRRSKGLQDFDERMAILVQEVQGERFDRYFFPFGAGVAFSRNLYRWSPQIRKEDGFARLVWGLGTRAVERVGNDYPHLVALSHPMLQPDDSPEAIRCYSQKYVDLIDLEENQFKVMPVHEVLNTRYKGMRFLAQIEEDGFFLPIRLRVFHQDIPRLAITYDQMLKNSDFAEKLSALLKTLETHYQTPVDVEFTLRIPDPDVPRPPVEITLLQCRPQSHLRSQDRVTAPKDIPAEKVIFATRFMVPQGYLPDIRYVLFIHPEQYFKLPTEAERSELRGWIAQLNQVLGEKRFICVGPGRWGTTNSDLGVFVSYSDIHNSAALVELSGREVGLPPEGSLGTHFFQDLMEAEIYPICVPLGEPGSEFNAAFFYQTPNEIEKFISAPEGKEIPIHLIDVGKYCLGHHMEVVMDDESGQAVGFLVEDGKAGSGG